MCFYNIISFIYLIMRNISAKFVDKIKIFSRGFFQNIVPFMR